MRVRMIYEKRGGACFVPHIALATLFTRAARRAGIALCPTEGFSPHAKISFGPELAAGVVALGEPVDLWLKDRVGERIDREKTSGWVSKLNAQMPEGFRVKACAVQPEAAPALGKSCEAAHYWIWKREPAGQQAPQQEELQREELPGLLRRHFGEDVLFAETMEDGRLSFVLANPAKNGLGGWVKALTAEGVLSGWQDFCIVRLSLGRWNRREARVETLEEALEKALPGAEGFPL